VYRINVGAADLAASRFAISPLIELRDALRLLSGRSHHRPPPGLRAWLDRARPAYDELRRDVALDAVVALQRDRWGADFIAPPPISGLATRIDDEIAAVRSTPPGQARAEIGYCLADAASASAPVLRVLRSRRAIDLLADALEAAWNALLAPHWPQLRAILERDVLHRAARLTDAGWAKALDDLHPNVHWRDGGSNGGPSARDGENASVPFPRDGAASSASISAGRASSPHGYVEIRHFSATGELDLDGRGLLFLPSAFGWPGVGIYNDPPWHPALIYPARGIAALWDPPDEAVPPGALGRMLGSTRARILLALDEPASTSQLVGQLGASLGAVGDHLTALRDVGLVNRSRAGRSVLYRRTPVGDALVGSAGAAAARR
jgi:DNA-binding transcriptional ArsR family regulator